jgi:ABC-type polysaccharide/polyol phosphate export permease
LTANDLKLRYLGSSIGFFWAVINPIIEVATYAFVFNVLLQVRFHTGQSTRQYVLYLLCGMVAWSGFADAITRATTCITGNAHLLRKVNFPPIVLPAQMVGSAVVNQAIRWAILLIACVLVGDGLTWHILLIPIFVLAQSIFCLGAGLLLSVLQVHFRDIGHWVNVGVLVGMFLTPVMYSPEAYIGPMRLLLHPNPMAQYIGLYRRLLLEHQAPGPVTTVIYAFLTAAMALVVGASVFAHNRRRFADMV